MKRKIISAFLVVALLVSLPSLAAADDWAVVGEAQAQLNIEGIQAMKAGDYDKAIRLFRSALDLSELNVTYLNLGRALTRSGRCEEAVVAYEKVLTSPQVEQPSPEVVKEKLVEYRAELNDMCPGQMAIKCSPENMRVSIDGQEPIPCPSEVLTLDSGSHRVIGKAEGSKVTVNVTITAMEVTDVHLELDTEGKLSLLCKQKGMKIAIDGGEAVPCPVKPLKLTAGSHKVMGLLGEQKIEEEVMIAVSETTSLELDITGAKQGGQLGVGDPPGGTDEGASLAPLGWSLFGVGAAALVTATILDFTVLAGLVDDMESASDANDRDKFDSAESDFSTWQGLNIGLLVGGGALVIAGAVVIAIDMAGEAEAAESEQAYWEVHPLVGQGEAGVGAVFRW